jgi:hypothetical protein
MAHLHRDTLEHEETAQRDTRYERAGSRLGERLGDMLTDFLLWCLGAALKLGAIGLLVFLLLTYGCEAAGKAFQKGYESIPTTTVAP